MALAKREVPTYIATSDIDYDADIPGNPTGVIVNATGGLVLTDIEGNQRLHTVPAAALPWRLDLRFRQIKGDGAGNVGAGSLIGGTDIALANLAVIRSH